MSEVLQLVKLILLVPNTIAVRERLHITSCRAKTYLRSAFTTQEPVTYCLILTTYNKQVHKPKLVEAASQFCFKNKNSFSMKE